MILQQLQLLLDDFNAQSTSENILCTHTTNHQSGNTYQTDLCLIWCSLDALTAVFNYILSIYFLSNIT